MCEVNRQGVLVVKEEYKQRIGVSVFPRGERKVRKGREKYLERKVWRGREKVDVENWRYIRRNYG